MNNEVLRRKLFRTVLADSRSPAGILASSPEMVETVQRRANGGISDRRRIAGQQFARLSAGLPEGTEKPESYLQVLARIKNLPPQQQAEELMKAGFGAEIGPDIKSGIAQAARPSERAAALGENISGAITEIGDLIAPDVMTPGERRYQKRPDVSGLPGGPPFNFSPWS